VNLPQQAVDDRKVCQNCFIKFNELDEHQTIVEKIQNDLLVLYNNTLSASLDIKHGIKIENYDIAEVDVPEEDENFFDSEPEYKPTLERTKKLHRRRERYEEEDDDDYYRERRRKRSKTVKRDDDDYAKGYTVIEIDGEKWYKCDVCQKVLQRRIKNHREIHTSERNVKCEVCGSMFKTLACLYTHRKIHKERKYHQW
jgi:DNA-directed RNA polymerase subunit RPC12/RpoP